MSSRRTLILVAAIAVGVFAGIALLNYVRGIEDDVYADAQPVTVLMASEDIPEGTAAIDALEMMEQKDIPLEIRPATFIPVDGVDEIAGLMALGAIPKNQIIVRGLFVDPTIAQASFRDQIPSGQTAVTLQISQNAAVGGYLQPGDEVNLLVTHDLGCGTAEEEEPSGEGIEDPDAPVVETGLQTLEDEGYCTIKKPARYFFQRVEILAIGARQTLQPGQSGEQIITPQGGPITFMVPNEAAQLLVSLDPESIHLTLLPDDYEAEAQNALTLEVMEGPTHAEIADCLTPHGPAGFIAGAATSTVADEDGAPNDHFSCEMLWGG